MMPIGSRRFSAMPISFFYVSLLFFSAVFLLPSASTAQAGSKPEGWWLDGSWPHEHSSLEPRQDAVFGRLENGLRYVLLHHESPRGRAALYLDMQVGSLMETDTQAGIAHFMEHMVFNGSRNFAPGELIKYFQSIGMSFGGDANAHTAMQETMFKLQVPTADMAVVKRGFVVLGDFLDGALLLEKEVASERGVILKEKAARDSESFRASQRRVRFLFPGTRFVLPTIGSEEVIKKADASLLRGFYNAWYRPELAVVIGVGDFDVRVVEEMIKDIFSKSTSDGKRPTVPAWGDMNLKGQHAYYDRRPGTTGVLLVEAVHPRKHERDSLAVQRTMLAEQLGFHMMQARLMSLTNHEKTPVLKSFAHYAELFGQMPDARMMAIPRKGRWKESLSLMENELRRALQFGFTDSELARARNYFANYFRQAVTRESSRDNSEVASEIALCMNQDRVYQSPQQTLEMFNPMLRKIGLSEVNRVFRSAWNSGNRIVSLTGVDLKGEARPEEVILNEWNKAAKVKVVPWKGAKDTKFPYLAVPQKKGRVLKQQNENSQSAPYVFRRTDFANGVSLFMKPTDVEQDRVQISLEFGPGTASMDDREQALASFSLDVLNQGGIGRLTRLQQSRILAGRKVNIAWKMTSSGAVLTATCLQSDLDLVMHLLRTALLDPVVQENDYRSALAMLKNESVRQSGTCAGMFSLKGRRFLAGGMGHFADLDYTQIKDFDLGDVRDFVIKNFKLGPISLCVVGDFLPGTMEKTVARFFGTLPRRAEFSKKSVTLKFPAGKRSTAQINKDLPQSGVILALPVSNPSTQSKEDEVHVGLLRRVLADRLRVTLREKLGAAYSPRAYLMLPQQFPEYGYMAVQVETDAGKHAMVEQAVRAIYFDLARNGITKEELVRAKKQALSLRGKLVNRLGFWRYLLTRVAGGQNDAFSRAAEASRIIKETSTAELSSLARRYFEIEKAAVFTVLSPDLQ